MKAEYVVVYQRFDATLQTGTELVTEVIDAEASEAALIRVRLIEVQGLGAIANASIRPVRELSRLTPNGVLRVLNGEARR